MPLLEVNQLKKVYTTRFGGNQINALNGVSFTVEKEEYVAIMGESGSGKTTPLNILAALDKPTGGAVLLNGRDMKTIPEGELAAFRRDHLGFVFQDFNLLDTFSLEDNIYLPMVLAKKNYGEMKQKADPIVGKLGMDPAIILADEPTGALDSRASDQLLDLFGGINREGQTILMVTHSVKAASHAKRVLFIKDGEVFHQLYRGEMTEEKMYQRISDTLAVLEAGGGCDE